MPQPFELRLPFAPYIVCLFDDATHQFGSADNVRTYDREYSAFPLEQRHAREGAGVGVFVRVAATEEAVASCLLSYDHLWTPPRPDSALIHNATCIVAVGSNVFGLALPSLDLKWRTPGENSGCYSISYSSPHDSLIVREETGVMCLDINGHKRWNTGFLYPETLQLRADTVEVTNDLGRVLHFDINTGKLLRIDNPPLQPPSTPI